MQNRILSGLLCCAIGATAHAGLLNVVPGLPLTTYDNQGTTVFDASTGLFEVNATPLAVRFVATEPPRIVMADGDGNAYLILRARVAPDGSLLGGVDGDDFIVIGAVDQNGDGTTDYSGVLLSGEVAQFGFQEIAQAAAVAAGEGQEELRDSVGGLVNQTDSAIPSEVLETLGLVTALYDFRIYPTGGALAPFYAGRDCGLRLTSEQSTFDNNFATNFMGEAKGTFGPIDTNRIGACCLRSGDCVQSTEAQCAAANGSYNGDGTDCEEINSFLFERDYSNNNQSASAGRTGVVRTTFNPVSKRLTWEATFTPEGGVLPNGFTLAINDGPNLKGLPGELALFYFDASGSGGVTGPVLTVYGYNGLNNPNSFRDGDGVSANDPNPDTILSSISNPSWVNSLTVQSNSDGTLTLGFDINASEICSHIPAFPAPDGTLWEGAQFGNLMGFWFHPFRLTGTPYDAGGFLTSWNRDREGWVDVENQHTDFEGCIPVVGSCCLPSGECAETTGDECASRGGAYGGDDTACADLDVYVFTKDYTNRSQNKSAGRVTWVYSSFNPTTGRLVWEATFSANNGVLPNAFTQVINDGPNPNGLPGQLAIFYFDASNTGSTNGPVLSVYGYNGQNNFNSYRDGDGNTSNDPNPDSILSSLNDSSWVNSLTFVNNPDGTRTLGFDINTSAIRSHVPEFPSPSGDQWFGVAFDSRLGFWFHPHRLTRSAYGPDGFLKDWKPNKQGWLDVADEHAFLQRCPRMPLLVTHYNFAQQSGSKVVDLVGDIDLDIIQQNGTINWITDSNGTGVYFNQTSSGKARIATASPSLTDALRNRLTETDAVTVQVLLKQDGGNVNGSRIVTWSDHTDVARRNFAMIGRYELLSTGDDDDDDDDDSSPQYVINGRFRLTTDYGTTDSGLSNGWGVGQTVVLTMTYDRRTDEMLRVYRNGVQVITNKNVDDSFDMWKPYNLILGNEATLNRAYKGAIYDVKIWDGCLTPDEVAAEAAIAGQD